MARLARDDRCRHLRPRRTARGASDRRRHTLSLHDDLIHVPLIVKHPGRSAGTRVAEVVQTLDLYRTILGWTGTSTDDLPPAQVELPSLDEPLPDRVASAEEDYTDSWNVVARLQKLNPSPSERAYPFSQRAARSATHKLVEYETGPGELYDLRMDPGERSNLLLTATGEQMAALHTLQMALRSWEARSEIFPPVELQDRAERSAEVEDRLLALGYGP